MSTKAEAIGPTITAGTEYATQSIEVAIEEPVKVYNLNKNKKFNMWIVI